MNRFRLVLLPLLLAWSHAADIENVGKQRISKKIHEHAHANGGGFRRQRPTKEYIYVYNMPAKFTTDIQQLAPEWHSDQYDYDQVRHAVMRAPQHRVQSKVTAT